jgi:hypothetical protein
MEVGSFIVTGERLESADLIKTNLGHLLSCPLHLLDARTEVTQSALLLEYLVGMTTPSWGLGRSRNTASIEFYWTSDVSVSSSFKRKPFARTSR